MHVSRCYGLLWLATLSRSELLSPRALHKRFLDQQQNLQPDQQFLSAGSSKPLECFQVTHPVETHEGLGIGNNIVEQHDPVPSTTIRLVEHSFGNSYGKPFVGHYEPPDADFTHVFINVTVTASGHQFDRLATMWLGDVEVWRTSTAEPTQNPGIVWHFLKDMTTYHSLWTESQTVIFDLGNIINEKYTAPFNVTVDAVFFKPKRNRRAEKGLFPADIILPISAQKGDQGSPSAFTFPGDAAEAQIKLPSNARTAVMSVAATGQAKEEFWWSNAPETAVDYFDYADGEKLPGLGSFREVRVYIDGYVAGLAWPFHVIFTGGIAPPLHRPMVGIQAFDMREDEIDLTPWIGILSDGQEHTVSMEVFGVNDTIAESPEFVHAGSHWVLSGKVFVWLGEDEVVSHEPPELYLSPIDYQSRVWFLNETAVDYTQSISRRYVVRSSLMSDELRNVVWSQEFSMTNDGALRESGYGQYILAAYDGLNFGQENGTHRLSTKFNYPISTSYLYQYTTQSGHLDLEAMLSQELALLSPLDSPFATGVEAFLDSPYSLGTSALTAITMGRAKFTQDSGKSTGSGWTDQDYRLGALDLEASPAEWRPLYKRYTSVVNETVPSDKEYIRGKELDQPILERSHYPPGASEFAPLPLNQFGGVNIFLQP